MLSVLLAGAVAAAPVGGDTITLAEARGMATPALATRILGASGVLVGESDVQTGIGMWGNPHRLVSIVFASKPVAAGYFGLCQASIITASFTAADPAADPTIDAPSVITDLRRQTVFRAVDAGPVPTGLWTESYGRALDTACAALPPVLKSDVPNGISFFRTQMLGRQDDTARTASFLVRLLADTAAAVHGGTLTMRCATSSPSPCSEQIAGITRETPDTIGVQPCEKAPLSWCVEARYPRGWLSWMTLTVTTDAAWTMAQATRVHGATLDEIHAVE